MLEKKRPSVVERKKGDKKLKRRRIEGRMEHKFLGGHPQTLWWRVVKKINLRQQRGKEAIQKVHGKRASQAQESREGENQIDGSKSHSKKANAHGTTKGTERCWGRKN